MMFPTSIWKKSSEAGASRRGVLSGVPASSGLLGLAMVQNVQNEIPDADKIEGTRAMLAIATLIPRERAKSCEN
jgi:hypothetical protein